MKREKWMTDVVPIADEVRIAQTIAAGQDYMRKHIPHRTSAMRLFADQLRYVSPLFWGLQCGMMAALLLLAWQYAGTGETCYHVIMLFAPVTALYAVPELLKDLMYNTLEMEMSCKYSGGQVLAARLGVVGMINTIVLLISAVILGIAGGVDISMMILCALVPANCVHIFNLAAARWLRLNSRVASISLSLFIAFAVCYVSVYVEVVVPILGLSLIVTWMILVVQCIDLYKQAVERRRKLVWNYQ